MPRAYLFDIGNVIVSFDFSVALQRLATQSGLAEDAIMPRLSPLKDALESGAMSDEEFITQSMERISFRGSYDEFAEIWGDIFANNEPMTRLIEQLAEKAPLYLLSNTSGIHKDFLFERFPVFRHFTGGIYSHEARSMKPDEPIYRAAIDSFGLDPAGTFYIDDLAPNIVTAQRLGFITHHYDLKKHEALLNDLDRG